MHTELPLKFTLFMKHHSIISFILILFTVACNPSEQERAQQEQRQMQMQMQLAETTPEFNSQVAAVLDRYFDLKDALVESDAEKAKEKAASLATEAENVDPQGLNQETTALWTAFSTIVINSSNEIVPLADVDDQRYHFEYVSEAMITMVETFRPVGYAIYHQSCPMVRGGSADWLSREEQIANPYHGDRMMRCGEVIRRI
jgi:membrane fusion protein, copper/silver efflux system